MTYARTVRSVVGTEAVARTIAYIGVVAGTIVIAPVVIAVVMVAVVRAIAYARTPGCTMISIVVVTVTDVRAVVVITVGYAVVLVVIWALVPHTRSAGCATAAVVRSAGIAIVVSAALRTRGIVSAIGGMSGAFTTSVVAAVTLCRDDRSRKSPTEHGNG